MGDCLSGVVEVEDAHVVVVATESVDGAEGSDEEVCDDIVRVVVVGIVVVVV